jgi:hypothetical protein
MNRRFPAVLMRVRWRGKAQEGENQGVQGIVDTGNFGNFASIRMQGAAKPNLRPPNPKQYTTLGN